MRRVLGLTAIGFLLTAAPLHGQAIQAFRGQASTLPTAADAIATISDTLTTLLAELALQQRATRLQTSASETEAPAILGPEVDRARALAEAVLDARSSGYPVFLQRYRTLRSYQVGLANRGIHGLAREQEPGVLKLAGAPPAAFKLPDVNFVIGATTMTGPHSASQIEISTNLLGATVGTAFSLFDSTALKEYLLNNLTIGTGMPVDGEHSISATLGVGLGEIRIGGYTFWPAINIDQVDTSDARLPDGLLTTDPDAGTWSTPSFAVAVASWKLETIRDRFVNSKPSPIYIVGIQLPYYYPGSSFSADAALFSDNRSNYQHAGKVQITAGVYIPLQTLKPLRE